MNRLQHEYLEGIERLKRFCDSNTSLQPIVIDNEYPFKIRFEPVDQLSFFDEKDNKPDKSERFLVICGLNTITDSSLNFKMEYQLLNKLIKFAENLSLLHYHAFRAMACEEEGD